MIQWAIEAVVKAGITEVMLVTGGAHAGEFLRLLGNGHEVGLDLLTYGYQEGPGGIADALGLAERFADDEPILVMLADNVIERSIAPMVHAFEAEPGRGPHPAQPGRRARAPARTWACPSSAPTAGWSGSWRSPRTRRARTR